MTYKINIKQVYSNNSMLGRKIFCRIELITAVYQTLPLGDWQRERIKIIREKLLGRL